MPKGQLFSGELKQQVVEDVRKDHLSYSEAMKKYGIKGRSTIQQWERIYLTEGAGALYIDHRGRKSSGRPAKQPKQVEEGLLAENQRLRMELDYLKKLNALVSKEKEQNKKRK